MLQHHALPTSGVKTPAFRELFGTAEAVPSRELFMRWFVVVLGLLRKQERPNEPHGDQEHARSEEHTSELQSRLHLVCRLLLEKKNRYTVFPDIVPRIANYFI